MFATDNELNGAYWDLQAGKTVDTDVLIRIIRQANKDRQANKRLVGFMMLMLRSGSSWSDKIRKLLREVLFDGANDEVIAAAMTLLTRYKDIRTQEALSELLSHDIAKP